MSRIFICDLCGKPIAGKPSDHYKVKKLHAGFMEHWWEQIDVHEECIRRLMQAKSQEATLNNDGSLLEARKEKGMKSDQCTSTEICTIRNDYKDESSIQNF